MPRVTFGQAGTIDVNTTTGDIQITLEDHEDIEDLHVDLVLLLAGVVDDSETIYSQFLWDFAAALRDARSIYINRDGDDE